MVLSPFLIGQKLEALGPPRPLSPAEAGRFELLPGHQCIGFRGEVDSYSSVACYSIVSYIDVNDV